jgi:hypothetical protein
VKNYECLRLKAIDKNDLDVISCLCQDAIIQVQDLIYDKENGFFDVLGVRLVWECEDEDVEFETTPYHQRVHFGIRFASVLKAQEHNISDDDVLNFLALLTFQEDEGDGYFIHLLFSQDKEIRLNVSHIQAYVQDLDEPWPTQVLPSHEEETSTKDDVL